MGLPPLSEGAGNSTRIDVLDTGETITLGGGRGCVHGISENGELSDAVVENPYLLKA